MYKKKGVFFPRLYKFHGVEKTVQTDFLQVDRKQDIHNQQLADVANFTLSTCGEHPLPTQLNANALGADIMESSIG